MLNPQLTTGPLPLTEALVLFGSSPMKFKVHIEEEQAVFVVGLKPRQKFHIEVDNEEMFEAESDAGGILMLTLPRKTEVGVRLQPVNSVRKSPS